MNLNKFKKDNSKDINLKIKEQIKKQEEQDNNLNKLLKVKKPKLNMLQKVYNTLVRKNYNRKCSLCKHSDNLYCKKLYFVIYNDSTFAFSCEHFKEKNI